MNNWDYRTYCNKQGKFGFIKVYYREDGSIEHHSELVTPCEQDLRCLEFTLEQIAGALNKPTLYWQDMPKGEMDAEYY